MLLIGETIVSKLLTIGWLAIGFLGLALAGGCDRPASQDAPAPQARTTPTTAPAVALASGQPTTEPIEAADKTPPTCVMMIAQQPVEFPQAMIRFAKSDGHLTATLYSDDPKDALNNNYRGNGFYFQLPLDVTDTKFNEARWSHDSESTARTDTPYGIFLDGHRRQLQPLDVQLRILPALSGGYKVEMAGHFLSVDPTDSLASTQVVPVFAALITETR